MPDSREKLGGRARSGKATVVIPLAVLLAWFGYLWLVSGVLPATETYSDGRIKAQGYVKRVGLGAYKRHGTWTEYHENGTKAAEGRFQRGRKVGAWCRWDEAGRLIQTDRHADDAAERPTIRPTGP